MPELKEFKFLPISIQLETEGGLAIPLLRRGIPLPTERTHIFTTAADDQTSVKASIIVGESPLVALNLALGNALLTELPRAKRGGVTIKITLSVDRGCSVRMRMEADKGAPLDKLFQLFDVSDRAGRYDRELSGA